ncbi:uncharacterized protein ARMOST_01705 [Armillaria ostoyae]|uniref:Uncharacterized protein n=1 Tax=Armillaria ostoyae TaxID=47428 RepID=A0A284QPR8_ARMOS|nr:uncharacterized protein ARMOST_01705 [Armillaria ostoyae]
MRRRSLAYLGLWLVYNDVSGDSRQKLAARSLRLAGNHAKSYLRRTSQTTPPYLIENAISTTYLLTDQGRFLPSGLDGDQGLFALYVLYGTNGILKENRTFKPSRNWEFRVVFQLGEIYAENQPRGEQLAQTGSQCHSASLKSLIRSGSNHRTGNVEKSLAREIYDMLHNTDIWRDSGQVDAAFCGF